MVLRQGPDQLRNSVTAIEAHRSCGQGTVEWTAGLSVLQYRQANVLGIETPDNSWRGHRFCLLGLFDINMPLLYGEAPKAFTRLQLEIMRHSNDESIFAWVSPDYGDSELMAVFLETRLTPALRWPLSFLTCTVSGMFQKLSRDHYNVCRPIWADDIWAQLFNDKQRIAAGASNIL